MTADFKKKLWISFTMIAGGIAIAAVGLYILAGNLAATTAKIAAARALINKDSGSVAVYASLKEQAAQASTYQAGMDQLLPTQNGLINFDGWIGNIAARYGVSANIVFGGSISPPVGSATAGQESFTLTATGDLNSLVAFLDDIQSKSPGFLLDLSSFQLAKQASEYQIVSQGQVFFQP